MELLKALILGIIQGLTEFLPVSSSGHIELAKAFLGTSYAGDDNILMTVILHFATALSTIYVFRNDIFNIIKKIPAKDGAEERYFVGKIILSMIPAAVIGVLFDEQIDEFFSGNLLLVGSMLIVTGILLFLADKSKHTEKKVSWWDSIIVGISQAIAILPGMSRSGATISTSVLLNIDREKAARFSFLMVVPLIFGKIGKDLISGELLESQISTGELAIGFTAALVTGVFACQWMITLVKKSKLSYFSVYCFIIGSIAIASNLI